MSNINIKIIVGSTREGRSGEKIAKWIEGIASKRKDFKYEILDLKQLNLPWYTEATSPAYANDYSDSLVKKWSEEISNADGIVIITPEYNHGYTAPVKNALDLLYKEWNNKPISFVSYGGIAAGTRATQQLRQVAIELQMHPIRENVHIPMIWEAFDANEQLKNVDHYNKSAETMFDKLTFWAHSFKDIRAKMK